MKKPKKIKYVNVADMKRDYTWSNILKQRLDEDFIVLAEACEHRTKTNQCTLKSGAKKTVCRKMGACPLLQLEMPKHTSKSKLRSIVSRIEPAVPEYLVRMRVHNGNIIYKDKSNGHYIALTPIGKEVANKPTLKTLLLELNTVQEIAK